MDVECRNVANNFMARWILRFLLERSKRRAEVVGDGQTQLWRRVSRSISHHTVQRFNHVQHDIIVVHIRFMMMSIPVGRAQMEFHVSHPKLAVQSYFSIEKIRSGIGIMQTGINYFHHMTLVGVERSEWKNTMLPNVVQELFHSLDV